MLNYYFFISLCNMPNNRSPSFKDALPHLMSEWDYEKNVVSPADISCKSKIAIWFTCSKGHSFRSSPVMRYKGTQCKKCGAAERAVMRRGKASIVKEYPEIFKDWDYSKNKIEPKDVSKTDKGSFWWTCQKNHSYRVRLYSRIRSGGCKVCNVPARVDELRKNLVKEKGSFADSQPELLSEWNHDKNSIKPNEVTKKSSVKVWFKCSENHEWMSTPKRRSNGNGCPKCYQESDKGRLIRKHKLADKGINLSEAHPELAKEWDYEKNREQPTAYSSGSNELVGWKCNFGHSWKATIYNRTGNLSGCPYCKSSTSKLEVFILTEMRGLFKEVKWRHKIKGYECDIYIPEISTGIEVDGGYWHDDKIERDKLKFEVFKKQGVRLLRVRDDSLPIIEGEVVLYNKKSQYVDLSCAVVTLIMGDNTNAVFSNYIKNQIQIGEKEYKKILSLLPAPTKDTSLAELNEELSKEWDFVKNAPLTPYMFTANSEKKVFWICGDRHSWEASIKNRNKRKSGCPHCYKVNAGEIGRKALFKKSGISFGSKFPELLKEWNYDLNDRSPFELSPGSQIKAHWECKKGHKWQTSLGSRSRGHDCPFCFELSRSKKATQRRINETGTVEARCPEIIKEWDFDKNIKGPDCYPPGSQKRVNWICDKGHRWNAVIRNRVTGKGKCPTCKSIVVLKPELLDKWDYKKNIDLNPDQITPGSNKKIWWLCENGHSYQQSTYEKIKGHNACAKCK